MEFPRSTPKLRSHLQRCQWAAVEVPASVSLGISRHPSQGFLPSSSRSCCYLALSSWHCVISKQKHLKLCRWQLEVNKCTWGLEREGTLHRWIADNSDRTPLGVWIISTNIYSTLGLPRYHNQQWRLQAQYRGWRVSNTFMCGSSFSQIQIQILYWF